MDDYTRFVPSSKHVAVVSLRPETFRFRSRTTFLDAASPDFCAAVYNEVQAAKRDNCEDHYISLASFDPDKKGDFYRTANYAREFKSLYVDIDIHGEADEYPDLETAAKDLQRAASAAGLPYSCVVSSGRGLQVYWTLSKEITQARWQLLTADLYAILLHLGVKLDMAVYRDRARVVRLPDTRNSKSGTLAAMIYSGGPVWNVDRLGALMDDFTSVNAVSPIPEKTVDKDTRVGGGSVFNCVQNSKRTRELLKRIPAEFKTAVQVDGKHCSDPYSRWRNVVWAIKRTHLPDAWEMCVEWAMQAADQYDNLLDGLERTWDSDKDDGAGVEAGSLVYVARQYAKAKDKKFLDVFHWADAEEAALVGDESVNFEPEEETPTLFDDRFVECCEILFTGGIYTPRREIRPRPSADAPALAVAPVSRPGAPDLTPLVDAGPEFVSDRIYGGPDGELPFPFQRRARRSGFGVEKKMPGADDEDVKVFVEVSAADIELVDSRVAYENDVPSYSHIFRAFDPRGDVPLPPVELAGSLLNDTGGLARWVGQHLGQPFGLSEGSSKAMSIYFKSLTAMRAADGSPTQCVTYGGWQGSNGNGAFALNDKLILEDGRIREATVSHEVSTNLRGMGETLGAAEIQRATLECWGQEGNLCGQAVICLVASAPLAVFTPHRGGITYTHGTGTGTGKSTAHDAALAFYGDPKAMVLPGTTTGAGRQIVQVFRRDLPVYIDDYDTGLANRPEDPKNRAIRTDFLQSSQCREKIRSSQSGRTRSTGDRTWNAPLNLTINKRLEAIVPDNGGDTAAIHARTLIIDWESKRFDRRKFPQAMNGLSLENAIKENYGHLGQFFIAYIQKNKAAIRSRIDATYRELEQGAEDRHMGGSHRFHNSMVAAACVLAEWLRDEMQLNWDFEALLSYIRHLPVARTETMASLSSSDPAAVWTAFLARAAVGAVQAPITGTNARILDDSSRVSDVTILRADERKGFAYVSKTALNQFAIAKGIELSALWSFLRKTYPDSRAAALLGTATRVNMTEGVRGRLRQDTMAYAVPLEAVLEGVESAKVGGDSNVVALKPHG